MICVILAAGMGTRLRPLTKDIPKVLLEIEEVTLLERMIKNCMDINISKFIIVIGYNGDKVINLCNKLSEEYNIEIIIKENKYYEITNTSVSTFLASKYIEDLSEDFILINGDNVIDPIILSNLSKSKNSAMVIDNYKMLNEESFKVIITKQSNNKNCVNGEIKAIGKDIDIKSSNGEFIGISKIVNEDIIEFNNILENLIEENPQNYYDFAFKDLSEIRQIDFVFTNGLKWTEIDDFNDWKCALNLVKDLKINSNDRRIYK